jgi:hypothetical protein
VNEATANIWLPFDPRDWVQLTPAFGRLKTMVAPTGPKLIANNHAATYFDRCVHEGLLELVLVAPDLTYRRFNAAERQELHICVPLDYAEGCSIAPYYDGHWYVRRSDLEKLTAIPVTPVARAEAELALARTSPAPSTELLRVEPGRDVGAADVPVQGTQVKSGGPQLPATGGPESSQTSQAQQPPLQQWDPRADWSVETVFQELGIKGPVQEVIVKALPKIYGDDIAGELDRLVAKEPWQTKKLRQAIRDLLEKEAGRTLRDKEIPSWDACKDFLVAWYQWRAHHSVKI